VEGGGVDEDQAVGPGSLQDPADPDEEPFEDGVAAEGLAPADAPQAGRVEEDPDPGPAHLGPPQPVKPDRRGGVQSARQGGAVKVARRLACHHHDPLPVRPPHPGHTPHVVAFSSRTPIRQIPARSASSITRSRSTRMVSPASRARTRTPACLATVTVSRPMVGRSKRASWVGLRTLTTTAPGPPRAP